MNLPLFAHDVTEERAPWPRCKSCKDKLGLMGINSAVCHNEDCRFFMTEVTTQ